jgi:peptidoglycan/xylan/chitin deacetylase (PgdA/CDA1 family)
MKRFLPLVFCSLIALQCSNDSKAKAKASSTDSNNAISSTDTSRKTVNDAATILKKQQIPVLCYHHIEDWKPNEKSSLKLLLVPVEHFKEQIKSLADSGYHTITPDQYYKYLTTDAPLPSKPVMITFDDTDGEQFDIGSTELNKYNFKGVFFIMTISIGKKRYMTAEQLKQLSEQGHVIAAHTWDHQSVKKLSTPKDYDVELVQPKKKLEEIIGKPVDCFAYPFGIVDSKIFPELKKAGYTSAYQLVEYKRDSTYPLYTIRRMIVPGAWDGATLQKWMRINFHS